MRVVTMGELLLRLAAPGYTKLFQKDNLEVTFCGGEANVAVSLAMFGVDSRYVTKLPNNQIGYSAAHSLDYFNVDTSHIIYGDGRLGLYYLEKGASQRPSKVFYDRANSVFATVNKNEFNWDEIFEGANWFHWTGITPALSKDMDEVCLEACQAAKKRGIVISCDLNYRAKLWTPEIAQSVMKPLMKYVDICICNEEDAEKSLGIRNQNSNIEEGELNINSYLQTSKRIVEEYGCKFVATTLRKSVSASRNYWSAMLYDAKNTRYYLSHEYDIQLVDRVGGGDSFSAGLIFSFLEKKELQESIDFATAASCLKQTIEGDFNRSTVDDVIQLLKSKGNGRVIR